VETNTAPNFVRVFYRGADGTLAPGPTVATGGSGSATAPPLGLAVTDSAGSVTLTENNNVLLVTNSGSNTISSFRVLSDGNIVLADQESSGGVFPVSVAASGLLVYAFNEGATAPAPIFAGVSGSVSGFTLDSNGNLTAIPASTRAITGGTNSAQVGFNNKRSVLTVTNRNHLFAATGAPDGTISTWTVGKNGLLGA
jgi:6-phosphogluconolactonase